MKHIAAIGRQHIAAQDSNYNKSVRNLLDKVRGHYSSQLSLPNSFQDRLTTLELKLFSSARCGIFTMSENDERSGIKELKEVDLIFLLNGVPQCFITLELMYGTISVMLSLFKCRRYSCCSVYDATRCFVDLLQSDFCGVQPF